MNASPSTTVSTLKRRWFTPQFSLRTLFIFITVLSMPLGLLGRWYFRERLLIAAIVKLRESGASVGYDRMTGHLQGDPIAQLSVSPTEPSELIGLPLAVSLALTKPQCEALAGVTNVTNISLTYGAIDTTAIAPLKNAMANRRLTLLEIRGGTPFDSPIEEISSEVLSAVVSAEKIEQLILFPYELDRDDVETLRWAEIVRVIFIGRLTPEAAQAIVDHRDPPEFHLGLRECTIDILEILAQQEKRVKFNKVNIQDSRFGTRGVLAIAKNSITEFEIESAVIEAADWSSIEHLHHLTFNDCKFEADSLRSLLQGLTGRCEVLEFHGVDFTACEHDALDMTKFTGELRFFGCRMPVATARRLCERPFADNAIDYRSDDPNKKEFDNFTARFGLEPDVKPSK